MDDHQAIVGRPTLFARLPGRHDAGPIIDKLVAVGQAREDISVLLRPKGTDAVLDLVRGEPAAGQSGDPRLLNTADGDTIILLHPAAERVQAIQQALTEMGAQDFQYEPKTVYGGAQSEKDVAGDAGELVARLKAEAEAVESGQVVAAENASGEPGSNPTGQGSS